MQKVAAVTPSLSRPVPPSGLRPSGLETMSDRELAARYWQARRELDFLRSVQVEQTEHGERSGFDAAGSSQLVHQLDALCQRIWNESRRRAVAGTPSADA